MIDRGTLMNRVGKEWRFTRTGDTVPIHNPATGDVLAAMPVSFVGMRSAESSDSG